MRSTHLLTYFVQDLTMDSVPDSSLSACAPALSIIPLPRLRLYAINAVTLRRPLILQPAYGPVIKGNLPNATLP